MHSNNIFLFIRDKSKVFLSLPCEMHEETNEEQTFLQNLRCGYLIVLTLNYGIFYIEMAGGSEVNLFFYSLFSFLVNLLAISL